MRITLVAAAMTAAVLSTAPAFAQVPGYEAPRATVHVADLDLSRDSGVKLFDRRLWQAADALCAGTTAITPGAMQQMRQCRAAVIDQAAAKRDAAIRAARRPAAIALATTD